MPKKTNSSRGALRIYKSYNFVDKDPILDWTRTVVEDAKMSPRQIQEAGGPTASTIYNWFYGKTRRPQFCTVAAAALACGVNVIDLRKVRGK